MRFGSLKRTLAAAGLTAAAVSAVLLPAAPAQAVWYELGPYSTLAECDDARAYVESFPEHYAQPCRYQNRVGTIYDGWYFNVFYQDA
jgi:hypothetical protein